MEHKDIKIIGSGELYYDSKQESLCIIRAVDVDDGACFIAEKFNDDLTGELFTTEACYLSKPSKPDCRNCDGSGFFYQIDNCVCGCVSHGEV